MAIIDVSNSIVQVGLTSSGSWATIADLTSWDGTHGTEGSARRRVFGQADPYVRLGEDTDTYRLSGLYNIADTDGQNVLRTARDNRSVVYLRVMPAGLGSGAKGYMQACIVTEYTDSGDAGGDYVECSFALEQSGAKTAVTLS